MRVHHHQPSRALYIEGCDVMVRGGYGAGRTITAKLMVNRATNPMQAMHQSQGLTGGDTGIKGIFPPTMQLR